MKLPSFDPEKMEQSGDDIFTALVEEQKIPVEPAVTITMTLVTEVYPDITNEEIGQLWRHLHQKYLMPSIKVRANKNRPQ